MTDSTKINELNQRAWTGVTQDQQAASEALQTARGVQQESYDAAQGNGSTTRDSAALAAIELDVLTRSGGDAPAPAPSTTTTTTSQGTTTTTTSEGTTTTTTSTG